MKHAALVACSDGKRRACDAAFPAYVFMPRTGIAEVLDRVPGGIVEAAEVPERGSIRSVEAR
jgi:hypothetical protein